jgi:hypothetical protein
MRLSHGLRACSGPTLAADEMRAAASTTCCFRQYAKNSRGTAAPAGADRAPAPTGCNPGCKVSATGGDCDQLDAALRREIPPEVTGSFRLGAGRSQVQILSPRLEAPANCTVPVSSVMAPRGPIRAPGSKMLQSSGELVYGATTSLAGPCSHPVRSRRIDHVRTVRRDLCLACGGRLRLRSGGGTSESRPLDTAHVGVLVVALGRPTAATSDDSPGFLEFGSSSRPQLSLSGASSSDACARRRTARSRAGNMGCACRGMPTRRLREL